MGNLMDAGHEDGPQHEPSTQSPEKPIAALPDPDTLLAGADTTPKADDAVHEATSPVSTPRSYTKKMTQKAQDPNDPDAVAMHNFRELLASGSPLNSTFWYIIKHPVTRLSSAVLTMFLNFFVYLGDPASYSVSMSYGTLLGDIYHGFFQPDDAAFLVPRVIFMVVTGVCGMFLGGVLQRRVLRDYFRIELFGYDRMQGNDPDRKPEQDDDGGLLISILTTALCWYFGLMIYNEILIAAGAHEDHHLDEGMHNWTFAGYNLVLAGLLAFVSDWWNIITVVDQMLQEFDKSAARKGHVATATTGYKAYGKPHPRLIKLGHWWEDHRIVITRGWLLVGWGVIIPLMIHHFNLNMRIVENRLDIPMGDGWPWARWNNEFTRMAVASAVACMNMLIVTQDWDFPDLNAEDVKIAATDFTEINVDWAKFRARGPWCEWLFNHLSFYISGKWFNYMSIFIAISFDWSYWFMTALVFRPCDYAQFWDSETGYIYTMDDRHLSAEHAGAAAAVDCPWFTDNKLQNGWKVNGTNPYVVRVATGTFSGVYTVDEDDAYVFGGWASVLWLLCLPPIFAYIGFFWIVGTHDKLVGRSKEKRVKKWLAEHGNLTNKDESDILTEMKEYFGDVNSHVRIAIERLEQGNCCGKSKSEAAEDQAELPGPGASRGELQIASKTSEEGL